MPMYDFHQLTNWSWYFCGSKTIAKLVYQSGQAYSGSEAELLEWVYSQEALSKFSIAHYSRRTAAQTACANDNFLKAIQAASPGRHFITDLAGCSGELLEIMTELFTIVRNLNTTDDGRSDQHEKTFKDLQARLETIQQEVNVTSTRTSHEVARLKSTAELYRLACLIYLERVGRGVPRWNTRVGKVVEVALDLLESLKSCERAFPMFVVSCEARTDEQRRIVLDVFAETSKTRNVGNMNLVRTMVEAAWVHDDLHGEEEVPALDMYNFVVSACQAMPSFT
ncbi:hypothetical protein K402DRAFT_348234 [Aulographum hederae CBS 113979]|uniref:Uncharacterized protein n=1 Tax=Aulographum hederae CBS 113979 TaxID=1176131 RepID=A0A6G1HAM6_9PEZI|nr:hypothetical protein K402DRAFT_348234 [Aulographum hederae CBS 113979]